MTMPGPMPSAPKDVLTVAGLGAAIQNLNPAKVKAKSQGRMSSGFLGSRGGLTSGLATTATNLFGGFMGDIVDDTSGTTVESPQDVSDQVESFFGNPGSKLFDTIAGFFSPILQGVTDGLTGAAATLAGLFQIRWDQVDQHDSDLGDLHSRTQVLEGVIGYAHAYAGADMSMTLGEMKRPVDNQIGPSVGVVLSGGSFTLQSKGLWIADAHQTFNSYPIGAADVWLGIRVYTPGGTLYAEKYSHTTESSVTTRQVHLPFTVPSSGYRVEMWTHAALGRTIWSGALNNGLSVSKESSETS